MFRPRPTLAFVGVAAGLLVLLAALPARAGWWDALDKGQVAGLGDVLAEPVRYQGGLVTFTCVFHRRDEVFNPLATPYHPSRYSNVAVWADNTTVWEPQGYRLDFPFVYIERRHPKHDALLATEPYTRLEVTARIKGRVRSLPCLEVVSYRETSQRLGRVAVESLIAGDRRAEMGDFDLAYASYQRALRPDLPPAYRTLMERRIARGLERLGRLDAARALVGAEAVAAATPEVAAPSPIPTAPRPAPSPGSDVATGPLPEPGADCAPPPVTIPPAFPPPARGSVPSAPPVPAGPPSLLTQDLPGAPVNAPPPTTQDLPGTPVGAPPPPAGGPDGPPRRSPRLSGVR